MYYLGFDIGGSSVKAVLVQNKKIIKSKIVDLPDSLAGLLTLLKDLKQELAAGLENDIGGAGFAVAGNLDIKKEKILRSYNIEYLNNQPIKKILEQELKIVLIKIRQDAQCFLLAESEVGLAQNLKNVFYFILGRGVGGACLVNGRILEGSHGAATEAGHMVLEASRGVDMEEMVSSKFIEKLLNCSPEEAFSKARQGDSRVQEVFGRLGKNLGIALANIINIIDPEAIILGGGLIGAREFIEPEIQKEIKQYVISPAAKETKIIFSELGREGGALGAALLFESGDK